MSKRYISGKRVICTGASSGIGAALSRQLVAQGADVLMVARREERLKEVRDSVQGVTGQAFVHVADITDAASRQSIADFVSNEWGGAVDVLINNAGVGSIEVFSESDEATLRHVMEVNFFAAMELSRLLLPNLERGTQAVICNVGSVLGHVAVPHKSEYVASKFALHGMTDALRIELACDGIDVTLVSPSTTGSEFFTSVLNGAEASDSKRRGMRPDDVARKIIAGIIKGKREIILSTGGKLLVLADRILPGLLSRIQMRREEKRRE